MMKLKDWVDRYCIADSNWTRMLIRGIKQYDDKLWDKLPDGELGFGDVIQFLIDNKVVSAE